ncbi:hypothetical protein EJB05_33792, partial [Eragrostis curvula]
MEPENRRLYEADLDADALDCGVCFLPLKLPIFQCQVGHVVCSPCRDTLAAAGGKCHVCGASIAGGGYRRCHAMERLVESVRVPCPNAARGCTARLAYYDRHGHRLMCAHAPCHCPDEACGFTGSTEELLDHFSGVHRWPYRAHKVGDSNNTEYFEVLLQDGFNVVDLADADAAGGAHWYLFVFNVARHPLGRAISVFWIHRQAETLATGTEMECELRYSSTLRRDDTKVTEHHQKSCFRVACTDLSNGLPRPSDCFQFVVPDCVVADKQTDTITVTAQIAIISRRPRAEAGEKERARWLEKREAAEEDKR